MNDMYRFDMSSKRANVDFNLAHTGSDFERPYTEPFNNAYMRALFENGRSRRETGNNWLKTPPGYRG